MILISLNLMQLRTACYGQSHDTSHVTDRQGYWMTNSDKDGDLEHHVTYAGSQNGRKTLQQSGSLLPTQLPKYYHNTLPAK